MIRFAWFATLCVCLAFMSTVQGLRFEILAAPGQGTKKCYMQWVTSDSKISGKFVAEAAEGQLLDVEVTDSVGDNKFWAKKNLEGEAVFSFVVHVDTNIKICVTNTLTTGTPQSDKYRTVHVTIDSKVDSFESHTDAENEKAKPLFDEIQYLESTSGSASSDVWYFTHQSESMTKVNEQIWARVRDFSTMSIAALILCAAGQTYYLYLFFKSKKLI